MSTTISRTLAPSLTWRVSLKPAVTLGGFLVCLLILRAVTGFHWMQGEVDWGAYLLSRDYVLGLDVTHADRLRPLLGPGWLLVPFTALWGDHYGLILFEIVGSFAPIAPLWLLCRRWFSEWQTIGILAFFSMDLILAEMFVTGILPILGFSLIILAIWALFNLAERWRWRDALVVVVALGLTAHMNQTASGLALIAIPSVLLGHLAFSRDWGGFKRMIWACLLTAPVTLTALPWFTGVVPGNDTLRFPGPLIDAGSPASFDWWKAYAGFITAGLVFWHAGHLTHPSLKALALLLVVTSILRLFMSHDEAVMNILYRSQHLTSFIIYPLLGWLTFKVWMPAVLRHWHKALVATTALTVFLFMSWGFIHNVDKQSFYSQMVSDDTLQAIAYINANPLPGAISTNSNSFGLYVAQLTKTPTTWVTIESPPKAWTTQHWDNLCIWALLECDLGYALERNPTGYVLVEENWWYERTFWGPSKIEIGRIYGINETPYPWWRTEAAPWIEPIGKWGTVFLGRVKEQGG